MDKLSIIFINKIFFFLEDKKKITIKKIIHFFDKLNVITNGFVYRGLISIWVVSYFLKRCFFFLFNRVIKNVNILKKSLGSEKTKFALVICVLIFFFYTNFSYLNVPLYKSINKYIVLCAGIYAITSTFIFLKNSYRFGKHTSQAQRFWKRSYILFWCIELFLFIFFSYLMLTHFTESNYFLDIRPLMYSVYIMNGYWVLQTILIFFLIYLNYNCLVVLKGGNYRLVNFFFCFMNVAMLILVYNEFYKFLYTVNYYYFNFKIISFLMKKYVYMGIDCSDLIIKTRTLYHYVGLVIFLKFWHFIFIYYFYTFVCGKQKGADISYDSLSSNLQNLIFYFFFNLMSFVFLFKSIIVFYFTEIYYWFFIGSSFKGGIYILFEFILYI